MSKSSRSRKQAKRRMTGAALARKDRGNFLTGLNFSRLLGKRSHGKQVKKAHRKR